ncbi:MAG: hypothetical protein ORN83_15195, partial [Chthoniobacteraceae bacterium]|nr:hypothetical protein [Chthoniobacteraceae bacterium]
MHRASEIIVPGYGRGIVRFAGRVSRQTFFAEFLKFQPQGDAPAFFGFICNGRVKRGASDEKLPT